MRRHARMPNVPRHVLFPGSGADPFHAGRHVPPSEAHSLRAPAMCAPRPRGTATESGVLAPRSSYSPRLPGRCDRPTRGRAAFVPGYSCGAASASDRLPGSYVKVCPRKCAPLIHPAPKPSQAATASRRFGPLAGDSAPRAERSHRLSQEADRRRRRARAEVHCAYDGKCLTPRAPAFGERWPWTTASASTAPWARIAPAAARRLEACATDVSVARALAG